MSVAIWVFMSSWLNQELNIPMSQIGLIWSGLAIGSVLAHLLVAAISDRVGKLQSERLSRCSFRPSVSSFSLKRRICGLSCWVSASSYLTNDFGHSAYEVVVTELQPKRRGVMMSVY